MKLLKLLVIICCLVSLDVFAACTQNGNSLPSLVGLDGGNGQVYADLSSNSNECSCKYVRFTPENTDTDKVLSVLLAAKMADMKVRVDLKTSGDCNSGYRVYVH